jgi:HD superfamily phosphohydrolase
LQVETISTGVDEQKVGELQTFVIGPKGVHATEAYVLGLFQLYPTIYLHKTTRGIEKIFTELMIKVFELVRGGHEGKVGLSKDHPLVKFVLEPTDLGRAQSLDDSVIYGSLPQLCDAKDKVVANLALRIRDRKTLKCFDVRDYIRKKLPAGGGQSDDIERSINRISLSSLEKIELWKKTSGCETLFKDEASRSPYKRFEESKGPLNQIMVRNHDGSLIDIGEYSPIVASIPRFDVLRYYFDRDNEVSDILCKLVDEEIGHG